MHAVLHMLAENASRSGITDVVLCPGSRSAPLVLAFVRHGGFKVHVFSDERSGGFIALGIAQRSNRPVILICTSGSAGYNFAAAVAEAFFSRVPLVVLTADRPREWIDQGDGQTIHQVQLFGSHVKRAWDLNADYLHPDSAWFAQRVICEAICTAQEDLSGPVHINFPFREPLYPQADGSQALIPARNVVSEAPVVSVSPGELADLRTRLASFERILIVAGQGVPADTGITTLETFAGQSQAVVVGDVLSNLHTSPGTVRLADGFLGAIRPDQREGLAGDLLITFGLTVISKNLKQFLRSQQPKEHWHLQPVGTAADTFQSLTRIIRSEPDSFFEQLIAAGPHTRSPDFRRRWLDLEAATAAGIAGFFARPATGEFFVVHEFLNHLPPTCTLHLANSMPVRYVNYIGLKEYQKVRVRANRGTSGIDGCTSTAVGHALGGDDLHVLLTGDVAFFYDSNAFWHDERLPNLRIVLLNNHGGVIFSLIDGPAELPELPGYFVTRQRRNARALCSEFGIRYTRYESPQQWSSFFAGEGPALMEIETTPEQNKTYFNEFKKHLKTIV